MRVVTSLLALVLYETRMDLRAHIWFRFLIGWSFMCKSMTGIIMMVSKVVGSITRHVSVIRHGVDRVTGFVRVCAFISRALRCSCQTHGSFWNWQDR